MKQSFNSVLVTSGKIFIKEAHNILKKPGSIQKSQVSPKKDIVLNGTDYLKRKRFFYEAER